jgi:tetratricopeptide (TPR) repeat protein
MKIGFVIILICFLIVSGLAVFIYVQSLDLKSRLSSTDDILKRTQQINEDIQQKLKTIESKNEQIRADSVSILNQNTRFQGEIEKLKSDLQSAQSSLQEAQSSLEKSQGELEALKDSSAKTKEALQEKITIEKKVLQTALANVKKSKDDLANKINREKAIYHYNLAVAYTRAELYDEAIDEYKESLSYNQNNPEAYYNLALLYEGVKGNFDKALWNYTKYTELAPDAQDRKEVEKWIRDLNYQLQEKGSWKSPAAETTSDKIQKGEKKTNLSFGQEM